MWHENAVTRKHGGDQVEHLFTKEVRCHCGGEFQFIGNLRPGFPDFTCDRCGQLVDVKSSPQAEQTGNLAVSAIPWSHYPCDMLLATKIHGEWIGEYKLHISVKNPMPYSATHRSRATKFHLISWKPFRRLSEMGYQEV
jgi:hypothetical protein